MATSTCLDEETSKKVIRQVEFYFSDSNLPRDTFLRKTISENEDGMVSMALICSFSRMRTHLNLGDVKADGVPEDTVKAVADTLRSSTFLKISDDGKKVGRTTELAKPEEVIEQVDSRTIAASPLPYDVKLEEVESFFNQYGKVNSVRLPRHVSNKNIFCGTALVEFSTEEDAEKFLKETLAFAGAELELKPKKDFDAEREGQAEEYEKTHGHGHLKGSEEASYPKGLIIAFKLKSKSDEGESKQNDAEEQVSEMDATETDGESVANASEEPAKAVGNVVDGAEGSEDKITDEAAPEKEGKEADVGEKPSEKKDEEKSAAEGRPRADSFKNNNDVVIREDLKALFEKYGTVKYIDFKMGDESGYIRFEEPEGAQKVRAAAVLNEEGGLVVKNFIAILEPVTGDAEKEYWSQIQGGQRARDKGHKGRGGKFNRGGRHGRSRGNDSHYGRPNKVQKVAT